MAQLFSPSVPPTHTTCLPKLISLALLAPSGYFNLIKLSDLWRTNESELGKGSPVWFYQRRRWLLVQSAPEASLARSKVRRFNF